MSIITGLGLLTPLGASVEQTWRRLLAGEFITDHARAAGEYDRRSSPRVIQMARRVAEQALGQAGWSPHEEFATVVGTSKGSIENWLAGSPDAAGRFDPTGLAEVAAAIGSGPKLTVSGACASGLLALIRGAMMIRSGEARRVLVVAAEASVHPLFIGSFARLGVLPAPDVGGRPFDQARDGFLMSEAAAAICLEAEDEFGATGHGADDLPSDRPVAVEHFAMGGDAAHLTAADPDGRVLRSLIARVNGREQVDLVHAHGTGTVQNDPIELAAIESILTSAPFPPPALYSHKGALGHSLGAAGLVAVVLNVLAHRHEIVPPNVRTTRPLPARAIRIDREARHRRIRRSVAIASGFGGASAAVSLISI